METDEVRPEITAISRAVGEFGRHNGTMRMA